MFALILPILHLCLCFNMFSATSVRMMPIDRVKFVLFRAGERTTSALGEPIAQLTCVSGHPLACESVRAVRCIPQSVKLVSLASTYEMKWTCTTGDLPKRFVLDQYAISCEWVDSKGTEGKQEQLQQETYLIQGSCGLNFTVRQEAGPSARQQVLAQEKTDGYNILEGIFETIGILIGIMFLIYCLYTCCGWFRPVELLQEQVLYGNVGGFARYLVFSCCGQWVGARPHMYHPRVAMRRY